MQLWSFGRFVRTGASTVPSTGSGGLAKADAAPAQPQTAVTRSYGSSGELQEARQEMRKEGWFLISAWGEPDGRMVALWATRNKHQAA